MSPSASSTCIFHFPTIMAVPQIVLPLSCFCLDFLSWWQRQETKTGICTTFWLGSKSEHLERPMQTILSWIVLNSLLIVTSPFEFTGTPHTNCQCPLVRRWCGVRLLWTYLENSILLREPTLCLQNAFSEHLEGWLRFTTLKSEVTYM